MRIRVSNILEILAENVSGSKVLENFPDLENEDITGLSVVCKKKNRFSTVDLRNI
jgi:uncharacterized protein (DUF433 family)